MVFKRKRANRTATDSYPLSTRKYIIFWPAPYTSHLQALKKRANGSLLPTTAELVTE